MQRASQGKGFRSRDPGMDTNLAVARLRSHGHVFEVAVNPDQALGFRQGKQIALADVLVTPDVGIFTDVRKGTLAPKEQLIEAFGTEEPLKIAQILLKEGELQTTEAYRDKAREEKRRRIISLIAQNAVDPKTGFPHPATRIESAMEEAKAKIDENKTAEEQVDHIVSKLRVILPIRFETDTLQIRVPSSSVNKCMPILKAQGMQKEEFLSDGSLLATVELPAGMRLDFVGKLSKVAHGGIDIKIIEKR